MSHRISLPELKIASPCPARWEDMRGDDRRRFCDGCGKHVHSFAAMHDAEIALLLDGRPICAQLYRRADGTLLTADCPIGLRLARTRLGRLTLRAAAASFALLASAAAAFGATTWGERILGSGLNATIGRLQAEPVMSEPIGGGIEVMPATRPATQPIRGEVATFPRPTLGVVAVPSTEPASRPAE